MILAAFHSAEMPSLLRPYQKPVRKAFLLLPLLLLAMASIGGYFYGSGYWEHRYDDLISRHSKIYKLDEKLVWSLIYQETWFRSDVVGNAGEVGLMQVTESVAREWAKETGMKELENQIRTDFVSTLREPERNIQIGCWYLQKLKQKYRENPAKEAMALAAYNAGPSRVEEWAKENPEMSEVEFISRISISTTKEYVRAILARSRSHSY